MNHPKDFCKKNNIYCHPILGINLLMVAAYISAFIALLGLIAFYANKSILIASDLLASPILFTLFTLISLFVFSYIGFSPNYKTLPPAVIKQLLAYKKDKRLHATFLNFEKLHGTLYVGDILKLTKALNLERKRLTDLSLDIYREHGETTPEIIQLDEQLDILIHSQKYLIEIRQKNLKSFVWLSFHI